MSLELPIFPPRRHRRRLRASTRLPIWTCPRRSRRRAAPTFLRRSRELREPRLTCRPRWALHGRERSSRWARRSTCQWRCPTQSCRRRRWSLPCRHRFRSSPSCPCPMSKRICRSPGMTSWTSISTVPSGFTAVDRSSSTFRTVQISISRWSSMRLPRRRTHRRPSAKLLARAAPRPRATSQAQTVSATILPSSSCRNRTSSSSQSFPGRAKTACTACRTPAAPCRTWWPRPSARSTSKRYRSNGRPG